MAIKLSRSNTFDNDFCHIKDPLSESRSNFLWYTFLWLSLAAIAAELLAENGLFSPC